GEVLEQMGQTAPPPRIIDASDPEAQVGGEHRGGAAAHHEEAQAVVERDAGDLPFEGGGESRGRVERQEGSKRGDDQQEDERRPPAHHFSACTRFSRTTIEGSILIRLSTRTTPFTSDAATAACWRGRNRGAFPFRVTTP